MAQQSSQAPAFVHPYGPEAEQLPVVNTEDEKEEEKEYTSLEEALTG